jgi:hypothetical protein
MLAERYEHAAHRFADADSQARLPGSRCLIGYQERERGLGVVLSGERGFG